jgi:unsaturated rhamnogalacturonyl hydrolase
MPFNTMRDRIDDQELREVAAKAADLLMSYPWKVWFWGDSIGLEGLLDAAELTRNAKYWGYVYGLFKAWIAREQFRSTFDYTAPGVALLRVFEITGDATLLEAAKRHAVYMSGFRKTKSGAAVRYENAAFELPPELPPGHPDFDSWRELAASARDGGPCIFVDSMHFDAPFFAALYGATGDDAYRQLALDNVLSQIDLLYDPEDGLFHHFWIERTGARNGVAWGRGNGWGLLGLVDTLEHLPAHEHGASKIQDVLRRVLRRMVELQDRTGGWHTVLTDSASYIETSVAAFMISAASRAMLHGWVNPEIYIPVVELAMRSLLENVRPDGLLDGVSYETFPSTSVQHYRRMPRGGVLPWGQGPLLAALWWYSSLRNNPQYVTKGLSGGSTPCASTIKSQS